VIEDVVTKNKKEIEIMKDQFLNIKSEVSQVKSEINQKLMLLKTDLVRKQAATNDNVAKNKSEIQNVGSNMKNDIHDIKQDLEYSFNKLNTEFKAKIENTDQVIKEHQKDINNKLASGISKVTKKINLLEANSSNKVNEMQSKYKDITDTHQKTLFELEFKVDSNSKQTLDLTDTTRSN